MPLMVRGQDKPHYSANEGGYWPLERNKKGADFDEYLTTAISRDAAGFVKEGNEPFCLYLAYNAPHAPLEAPAGLVEKYAGMQTKQRQIYAAMIDAMDQGIGMVVDALKESGKFDNTLIFFLSDNGGIVNKFNEGNDRTWGQGDWSDNGPLRGGKGSMREGGCHVPFIAHWPAGIPAGIAYAPPVSALDIAATAVAVGDGDTSGHSLEGKNLIPYVKGEIKDVPHKALFWRMQDGINWAVRTPEAKFLLPRASKGKKPVPELYDMVNDPYESNNIIEESSEARRELATLWNEWNAGNMANQYLQAGDYQKTRLRFYEELRQELDARFSDKKLLVIE